MSLVSYGTLGDYIIEKLQCWFVDMISPRQNTTKLRECIDELATNYDCPIVMSTARFDSVYFELMPVQQQRVDEICGQELSELMSTGFFISIGVAYPRGIIECINRPDYSQADIKSWNRYAAHYSKINSILDIIAKEIAIIFDGIPIPATLSGFAKAVEHVTDYFPLTISHWHHII